MAAELFVWLVLAVLFVAMMAIGVQIYRGKWAQELAVDVFGTTVADFKRTNGAHKAAILFIAVVLWTFGYCAFVALTH